jgi:hypothetical protein
MNVTVQVREIVVDVLSDSHGHTFSEIASAVKRRAAQAEYPYSFPIIQSTLVAIASLVESGDVEHVGTRGDLFKAVLP